MKDKKLNVRIPAALDAALEHACTNRDSTKRGAVIEALSEWLQRATHSEASYSQDSIPKQEILVKIEDSTASSSISITREEAQWISRVLEILRRGPPIARVALESNLGAFCYLSQIAGTEPQSHVSPGSTLPDTSPDLQATIESLRRNEDKIKPVVERLLRAGESSEGKGKTATGTGGPSGHGGKPDKGSSGGGG